MQWFSKGLLSDDHLNICQTLVIKKLYPSNPHLTANLPLALFQLNIAKQIEDLITIIVDITLHYYSRCVHNVRIVWFQRYDRKNSKFLWYSSSQ